MILTFLNLSHSYLSSSGLCPLSDDVNQLLVGARVKMFLFLLLLLVEPLSHHFSPH